MPSFFIFLGMGLVSPILPIYAKSFNVSYTLVSFAISAYALGRFVADLPVGVACDRYGSRWLMIGGTLIMAITAFLNATTDSFLLFMVYRFIQGVGSSMWMTARTAILADILKPEERGRIMGYFQSFTLIGSAAGPTIGGFIVSWWDIKAPFYFYSFTGVISLILTAIFVKQPENVVHSGKHQELNLTYARKLLSNRAFSMACLATFTAFFLMTGIRGNMLSLYADGELGLTPIEIGTIMSYATIMNLILTIPIGYSVDWFGRKPVIIIGITIAAIASCLFPLTTDYISLSVIAVILGIGTTGAQQAPLAMATDATAGEPRGLSMGVYRFFGDIGFVLGPIILGAIADVAGLRLPFWVMGAILFVNVLLVAVFAQETYSRRANQNNKSALKS